MNIKMMNNDAYDDIYNKHKHTHDTANDNDSLVDVTLILPLCL